MNIIFEKGIPGFEKYRNFQISDIKENPKFKMINSLEDEGIGFIAISPFDIKKDYSIDLNNETIKDLDIKDHKDVFVLNLITLGKTLNSSTVNLKAPLIINVKNNKAKQFILQDDKYEVRQPLIGSDN